MVLPCFFAAASSTSCAAGEMSTPVPSPSMNGMTGSFGTCSVRSADIEIFVALGAEGYLAELASEEGRPGRRAQAASLPPVAALQGVVHERGRPSHRRLFF